MIISKTPLRISFVGGGTDLPLFYKKITGRVLSTAINKYIFVIIKKSYGNEVILNYSKKEIVKNIGDIKNEYIKESMKSTGIDKGVEITILSDIHTKGSGLGSSSSLIVGLLNALYHYKNDPKTLDFLAKEACRLEIDVLGKPIGKQDQYAASFGGFKIYTFNSDETVEITPITLDEVRLSNLESCLYLVYTGITRRSSTILQEQNTKTEVNFEHLKEMSLMPLQVAKMLEQNQYDDFGIYLDTAWNYKKQLANSITNPKIDLLYNKGLENGAIGGKLLGAGGGGFILFYVPPKNREIFIREISKTSKILPFKFEPYGSKIIFNSES